MTTEEKHCEHPTDMLRLVKISAREARLACARCSLCLWPREYAGPPDSIIAALESSLASERELLHRAMEALRFAKIHADELENAWQRGAIHETDGKGRWRSNRNVDVRVTLSAVLKDYEDREASDDGNSTYDAG